MARRGKDSSAGFQEFWKTEQKKAASRNLTFVQVEIEPAEGFKKDKKIRAKAPKTIADSVGSPDATLQSPLSRRQQVYEAQKRHRQRKAGYSASLEAQIAQLRYQYALVKCEGHNLAVENAAISQHLISVGVLTEGKLASPPSSVLDPNLDKGKNDLFDMHSPQPHESIASSGSDSEKTRSRVRSKSRMLLEQWEFLNSQNDASSLTEIRECRDLLFKDVRPFDQGEFEDKKAWEALADLVLEER